MSPFELNKIAGAILFAGLVAMISWIIPANIYHVDGAHGSAAHALPVAESAEHADAGADWSIAALNEFLANPKGNVPGTKMSFKGVKKDRDRANVLLFLQGLSE